MRLNNHEEEVLGQCSPHAHHSPQSGRGEKGDGNHGPSAGCFRFGLHTADRHRESEIVGGAFED